MLVETVNLQPVSRILVDQNLIAMLMENVDVINLICGIIILDIVKNVSGKG